MEVGSQNKPQTLGADPDNETDQADSNILHFILCLIRLCTNLWGLLVLGGGVYFTECHSSV